MTQFCPYPGSTPIRRGEIVFITGGNGSGKSTLLQLLCGLVRPGSGTLRIDGRDIWDDIASHRSRVAAVFNDFHLFEHVLADSGKPADDGYARALLERFGLSAQVGVVHGRLSTTSLSTGQRKRLALLICQAQARDILVLDEWAADQDPAFRDLFYREWLPELKRQGKTLLIVSHDDRYFDVADRIYALDNGQLHASQCTRSLLHDWPLAKPAQEAFHDA